MPRASVFFCIVLVTSLFSDRAFAGKLRSGRIEVVVSSVIVHGPIVHVGGWSALPATPKVAVEFDKLKPRTAYDCDVLFYFGATGWGSGTKGQVSPVQMVYEIKNCSEKAK